mgnify:CR=1 FL=1
MKNPVIDEFPKQRSAVQVNPISGKTIPIDYPEVRWWFAEPKIGSYRKWAQYDASDNNLKFVVEMKGIRECIIHGIKGIEFEVNQWDKKTNWQLDQMEMYARLTDQFIQWLAVSRVNDGIRRFDTFLDEFFEEDWGQEEPRLVSPDDHYGYTMANVQIEMATQMRKAYW